MTAYSVAASWGMATTLLFALWLALYVRRDIRRGRRREIDVTNFDSTSREFIWR